MEFLALFFLVILPIVLGLVATGFIIYVHIVLLQVLFGAKEYFTRENKKANNNPQGYRMEGGN